MVYVSPENLQHFAELGRLSASLLHEISNPLSAALINLELCDKSSPQVRRAKRDMLLLRRYVEAARQQIQANAQPTIFSLQAQLCQLRRVLSPIAKQAGVQLRFDPLPSDCKMYGDHVKFQQIVANLIVNAIQSYNGVDVSTHGPVVRVTLERSQDWLKVQVADWGETIAASEVPKLFEQFYTTKCENGHGLGIGLAIVKQYVSEDFGGSIRVSSSACLGTKFSVKLRATPH